MSMLLQKTFDIIVFWYLGRQNSQGRERKKKLDGALKVTLHSFLPYGKYVRLLFLFHSYSTS